MKIRKSLTVLVLSAAAAWAAPALGQDVPRTKLVIGSQDSAWPQIVDASGVLKDTPYEVQWAVLPGPAGQLSGLYSKAIDVGRMGDTSLIIEQARDPADWTKDNAPLQIVALWRNPDTDYPPIVTVVHKDANIKTLTDLRGKKWSFNFGGYNYLQYVLSVIKADLTVADIQPVQLADSNAAAAAFNAGRVDIYSGGLANVKTTVDKGEARVILTSDDLDIPALVALTARGDVIRDPAKSAALADFLGRIEKFWIWYADNLPTVEKIYIERIKHAPARAKFSAQEGKAKFYPITPDLVRREQRIADILFKTGDIKKKVSVDSEFNGKYNANTVPGYAAR